MKYNVQIFDLKVLDYKAFNPISEEPDKSGTIDVQATISLDQEKLLIKVTIFIEVLIQLEKEKELQKIGYIKTMNGFKVESNDWPDYVRITDGKGVIESGLDDFLVNISYNNSRGLLREKGKDDYIGRFILPLVDPSAISGYKKE